MGTRLAVCAVAMIGLVACGKSGNSQSQSTPRLPETTTAAPTASLPTNAAACRAQDIKLQPTGQYPGDTGDRGTLIDVVGRTNVPCTLEGTPFTTVKDSDGRVISVPADKPGQGPPAPKGKVVVAPGRPAVLRLYAPRECASGSNEGPPFYEQISVRVGNEILSATGLRVPATCHVVSVSPFYQG